MAGEGSIQPLLNNNKNLLRKKNYFRKDKSASKRKKTLLKGSTGELKFKKISDKKLQILKNEIQNKTQKEALKNSIYTIIALLIVSVFITFHVKKMWAFDKEHTLKTERFLLQKENAKKLRAYNIYMENAQEQFQNKHWKNAVHFYKKALIFKPQDSLANIQLIITTTQLQETIPQ